MSSRPPHHVYPLGEEGMHVIDGGPCPCLASSRGSDTLIFHNSLKGTNGGDVVRKPLRRYRELAGGTWTAQERDEWQEAMDVLTLHWPEEDVFRSKSSF